MMSSAMKGCHVHIWIPDYESAKGGIQVFSNFFIKAVCHFLPDAKITVFSKNDVSYPALPLHHPAVEFRPLGWWSPRLRTMAFSAALLAAGLREKPDAILSTHVNFAPVAHWLKRLQGTPFAAVAHGVDVWTMTGGMVPRALQAADRVLAVSRFTRDRLVEGMHLRPEKVGILPNAFDELEFSPGDKPRYLLRRFGLAPKQPIILTVARLAGEERYKGYDQVLRALPAVRRVVPDVHYVLGGRGPDRSRVEVLVKELGLMDCVTLAGYIPDHELRDFYRLSDVFAMPSKGEGFGIVFLEAMASGRPVIAGNKDGSVDALLDGKAGVLIDPDSRTELEKALVQTLSGTHPLAILRDPAGLQEQAIAAFGYARFATKLAEELRALGLPAVRPTEPAFAA